jgi:hypothetical protein
MRIRMKKITCKFLILVVLVFWGGGATQANSQDMAGFWNAPWKFNVNVYGWLPDAPASIKVADKEVVDVPEDLDTVLDSLDMTAMFELEAHKGPLVFFTNTVYYDGDYDEGFIGPISNASRRFELEEEVWAIKYGIGYELTSWNLGKNNDSPTLKLIPWIGGFFFHDDYTLTVEPIGNILDGVKVDGTFEFNTPMIGLTPRINFSDRWYINLSYSYGGWDVDDVKEIWDFIGNVGYRFTMWDISSRAFLGYRYLSIDHEDQETHLKVDVKGPFIGIGWEF